MNKDRFFDKIASSGLALTYDDVRLVTGYSEVPPADVNLASRFSTNTPLNIPIVSSAMDTVTEWRMAIELAKLGGIGVIHRSMPPKEQASQVKRVKYYLNGLINNPVTVRIDESILDILKMREEKDWPFHSFPVLDSQDRLAGLLTQNDFDFCKDFKLSAEKVMTTDVITADPETTLAEAYDIMTAKRKKILPLVDKDRKLKGIYVLSDVLRIKNDSSSGFNVDEGERLRVAAAVGVGDDALERVELMHHRLDAVVIDTAHGDSKAVYETLKKIKRNYSDLDVVVGNVSAGESAKRLVDAGANGIKVGQGPGSICTTRIVAGIGAPQVSAIYNCAKAIRGSGVPICADGGINHPGDISIALGVGADSVMMGRILASAEEAPGRIIMHQGVRMRSYRGMGSLGAMKDSLAARQRYQQGNVSPQKLIPEGVEALVPLQGGLEDVLQEYIGGLRSGMGYVGAASINELQTKADFYRITGSGMAESRPHDITVVGDSNRFQDR